MGQETAELQLSQPAGVVESCGREVPVVVGHHQQGVLTLVEVLTSDEPQIDQWDGRCLIHGDQDVATDFLYRLQSWLSLTRDSGSLPPPLTRSHPGAFTRGSLLPLLSGLVQQQRPSSSSSSAAPPPEKKLMSAACSLLIVPPGGACLRTVDRRSLHEPWRWWRRSRIQDRSWSCVTVPGGLRHVVQAFVDVNQWRTHRRTKKKKSPGPIEQPTASVRPSSPVHTHLASAWMLPEAPSDFHLDLIFRGDPRFSPPV
ncbi:hypothetical protein INR49_012213 [Caranx melampygus]|nr:hypothetical protein INR49_012213 [Caranx melampygus]